MQTNPLGDGFGHQASKSGQSSVSDREPGRTTKVRRDSQGSLPKTAASAYLDDNATEL
jgi:hypothetical protein